MSKSQAIVRTITVSGQVLPVTFRRFAHHVTASTPGKNRLTILQDADSFITKMKGRKNKVAIASSADKAFAFAVAQVWN